MNGYRRSPAVLCLLLALSACATAPGSGPSQGGASSAEAGGSNSGRNLARATAPVRGATPVKDPRRSVYFTPDTQEVPIAGAELLAATAERLKANRRSRVMLNAYTDELGSTEYCLALSEKWASLVAADLMRRGARPNQIHIHSLGSETALPCGNDACREAQRRVEVRELE